MTGPILFAYDGSELAKLAIEEAGRQVEPGREAIVLTVWGPPSPAFVPVRGITINETLIDEVKESADETAADGAKLAEAVGFRARGVSAEQVPIWQGIVDVADEHDASMIVLGSHGRTGLAEAALGSVAGAVASHSRRSVLIVHRPR